MKGQLAYKDVNGVVWTILDQATEGESGEDLPYLAVNAEGLVLTSSYSLPELFDEIDDLTTPEWTKVLPAEPIQQEALDRGAFANESE